MAKAVLTFALYQADQLTRRETVTQDIVKVGKDPKSHLRVDDELASRMHAVIEVAGPEDITLIDLGNEPGTMVNGARVNKCKLHVGDQIQVGTTTIVLERADAAGVEVAAVAPPAPPPFAAPPNPFAAAGASSPFAASSNPFATASNPFAAGAAAARHAQALHVPEDAAPGTYTYTMVKSGPDVSPDEVEVAHLASVEVMVLWGTNVLHVSHLTPPRNFYVGEEQGKNFACDFFIPSERLGTTRLPVVVGDRASVAVVIPPNARGSVEIPGLPKMSLDEARARAQPSAELSGGHQLSLPGGAKARIELGDFVFQVAAVNAGKPLKHGVGTSFDWGVAMYFGLSFLTIGGLLAAMAFFVPPMGLTDGEDLDKDALYLMQQYLKAAAEREQEEKEAEVVQDNSDNKEGGTGTRAKGEEGSMGNPTTKATNKRYAVQGPKDNQDMHLAR
jgi:pSer/pThr/pTyr-binding forkhead associated (FHA) protein